MSPIHPTPRAVAKHVRQALRAAVASGTLVKGTYRVRLRQSADYKKSYGYGRRQPWYAIDIQVKDADLAVLDPASAFACVLLGQTLRWTPEAYRLLKQLSNLMLAAVAELHRPFEGLAQPSFIRQFQVRRCTVTYSPDLLAAQEAAILEGLAPPEPEPVLISAAEMDHLFGAKH